MFAAASLTEKDSVAVPGAKTVAECKTDYVVGSEEDKEKVDDEKRHVTVQLEVAKMLAKAKLMFQ